MVLKTSSNLIFGLAALGKGVQLHLAKLDAHREVAILERKIYDRRSVSQQYYLGANDRLDIDTLMDHVKKDEIALKVLLNKLRMAENRYTAWQFSIAFPIL